MNLCIKEYLELSDKIDDIKIEQESFITERCKQLELDVIQTYGEYIRHSYVNGLSFENGEIPKHYGKIMCVFFDVESKRFCLRLRTVLKKNKEEVLFNIEEIELGNNDCVLESF